MAASAGDNDLPIAVRRKRRSSSGLATSKASHLANASTSRTEGIETPPRSPVRKKKRVRFSDPGPSMQTDELSSGLTPAVQRASLGSKAKKPNRRHSAPTSTWNLDFSESPASGIRQFAPLRQVLDGRVKRRLRRNGLSEEINKIEYSRKAKEKARLAELDRLRSELENKDREMQNMRDDWDLRSQFGDEVGNSQSSQLNDKVRELESQISALKGELEQREVEHSAMDADPDWTLAARDPFHDYDDDDDEPMANYDHDFDDTTNMNDIIASTPTRRSFLSPPSTLPNTPNIPDDPSHDSGSHVTASTQVDFVDPEKEQMEKQLAVLQTNLNQLSAAMEETNDYHTRLSSKLSKFMPSESSDPSNLDTALDTLLTRLALSQSSLTETSATLDALRAEINNLGFSPTSSPDEIITLIASQFRQARLDLEYLNPGEIVTGFENQTLLSLLVDRIGTLLGQVRDRDADIEQYREEELSLRQQLGAQVGGLKIVQQELTDAKTELKGLNEELSWQTNSNEKLKKALEGYREEVKGLEELVGRMENQHCDAESQLKGELEAAVRRADDLEADVESYKTEQQASRAVAEQNRLLLEEFKTKLNSALETIETLKTEMKTVVAKKDAEIAQLIENRDREIEALKLLSNQREDEKQEDYLADIAAREQRVEELSAEFQGLRQALGAANSMVEILESEKAGLETRLRDERGRANGVVMVMREQLKNALNVGLGFLEESDNEEAIQAATSSDIARPGKFLNGELARRRSSGGAAVLPMMKNKRRKYDSGLGFLDEEEGEEEDAVERSSDGHWMSEGNEILEM